MGLGNIGMTEILFILLVVLLIFGARRIPEIGQALGKGIREFKKSMREVTDEIDKPLPREEPRIEPKEESKKLT